ncbi:MAG: methyltransferase domain-containing protein [Sedimentisphaerales bacterium]|nr:methyltransferase domain-containing protein [Sedimentisphaerales bacterium]
MSKKRRRISDQPKTFGPVSDLERHLPTDWWRTLFNSLYLKTDGDVVENDTNTVGEVDLLVQSTGITPNDHILDLCCGQGRHCLELARRGFTQVSGIDRSRYLIRLAKKRAQRENLMIDFHEGDARKFRFPESSFQCVAIMGNSFGYFEREEDDLTVLETVKKVLISGGILAMDLVDGEWMRNHFERRSWEWIDTNHFVCRERSLAADGQRLISREVIVHAEKGVIADQFYAERLYDRETVNELLERLGFLNTRIYNGTTTDSHRNQDLGMMAHRMFITTAAPHKARITARRGPIFKEMTVIMGDPTLPDMVKVGGKFNPEDMETIRRLRDALAQLTQYNFRYIDNHASLLTDLRNNPPQCVLNLCDEGFNNDAFKELHVPAILEMLNIPYTGAGPACLGLCYNKALIRAIAASLDIPVPLETYFNIDDSAATLPAEFPALVKPNYGDSSIGITADAVVHDTEALVRYLQTLRDTLPNRPVLIEEFLSGKEYTVGVIGNPGYSYTILPPLEVDYSQLPADLPPILGYESKWLPDSPYWNQISYRKAMLGDEDQSRLFDYVNLLFERCGCRDYARFDFRADAGGIIKLLEVNPNPGWCWDGKFNIMAGLAGLKYADMLRMILEAAQERFQATAKIPANGSTQLVMF